MQLRKTLDVHLVDDRPLPRHFGLARRAPSERGIDDAAFLHQRRTIALVIGEVLVGVIELVAKHEVDCRRTRYCCCAFSLAR
jgi:hypothetical protein